MPYYFDNQPSKISNNEIEGFPICHYNSGAFTWEEALYKGNWCAVHSSAQGMGNSRERVAAFLDGFHADKSHFSSFEVEIDGLRLRDFFVFETQYETPAKAGSEHHTVVLFYPKKQLRLYIHTENDNTGILVRRLEIENAGDKSFAITGIFPLAGMLYKETMGNSFTAEHLRPKTEIGSFIDNHYLGEGEFMWQQLPKGTLKFGFERAMFNPPTYMLRDDVLCMYTIINIETSMMTQAEFTKCGEYYYARHVSNGDYIHFKAGADKRCTYRTVQPGERITSPSIHIGQFYGDTDTCVNAFNRHIRTSVMPERSQKIRFPIEYNHSGMTDNCQVTYKKLYDEADIAASVGAEIFVVDAGWFGSAAKGWYAQRGDWHEHELLEEGLSKIFDHARELGMKCGLWMEAEGMDFSSALAGEHPDWFIRAYNRNLPTLNLLKPECEEYVYNSITGILKKYRLDLFRIDGGLKEPAEHVTGDGIEGTSWLYFEKLYAIFDRIRNENPGLYFENCSGGGGRSDLGMMRRFDWMQATDNFAPAAQLRTVYGMSYALAPEQLLSITGAFMRHQTDADFAARSGLIGRPEIAGIADKPDHINPVCMNAWKKALRIYREEIRPMLDTCLIFHHTPLENYMQKGNWLVMELSMPKGDKSIIELFRLDGAEDDTYCVYPRGLSTSGKCEVYSDNKGKENNYMTDCHKLVSEGIPVRLAGKMTSEILVITKI
ncbi:MAG: glycoside hydrolase family 36 protein [Eubacteriales bacterium]